MIFLTRNSTIWRKSQSILFCSCNIRIFVCSIFFASNTLGFQTTLLIMGQKKFNNIFYSFWFYYIISLKFYLSDFLVNWLDDCLICLSTSLIALEISIMFSGQDHYNHFHQFLWLVYSHENINQLYNIKNYIVFECFLLQMNSLRHHGLLFC